MVVAKPGKSKKSVPYNAYVARDRQDKYHTRKKTLAKFRRFQRYAEKEENQEHPKGSSGQLMDRLLQEDPEAMEAEYERRLALSFGDAPTEAPEERGRKRKKRRDEVAAEPAEEEDKPKLGPIVPATRRKKLRRGEEEADEAPTSAAASGAEESGVKARKKAKVRKDGAEGSAPSDKKEKKAAKRQAAGGSEDVPRIYAKAMRQYEETQAAKAAIHQQKQDEIQEQNRRRKAHAKNRAMNYQLISQKTQSGQPRMQSRLDMMLSKLGVEAGGKGKGKGKGDRRETQQTGVDRSANSGRAGHKRQR